MSGVESESEISVAEEGSEAAVDADLNEMSLDDMAILAATSKSSLRLDYLRHYDNVLTPYKKRAINVLEIGIQNGASLRVWESYFSQAQIVGIDIQPRTVKYASERSAVEIGSQADREFLVRVASKYPPTIVIDDGSHIAEHVIISFETLFPLVEPGGCYIVEDLFLHFGAVAGNWRGNTPVSPQEYFAEFMPGILGRPQAGNPKPDNKLIEQIDYFSIIPGAAIFWKRRVNDMVSGIDRVKSLVERSNIPVNWVYLAIFILKNGGPADQAEHAARQAVQLEPITRSYRILAQALELKGDIAGAIEALEAAVGAAKNDREGRAAAQRLGQLRSANTSSIA